MSNVAGKAYAMNVLTPMRPSRTWVNTLIFMAARALPDQLAGPAWTVDHPLRPLVHGSPSRLA